METTLKEFLKLLEAHKASGNVFFMNTIRDVYQIAKKNGIPPDNLSGWDVWQKYCQQPF